MALAALDHLSDRRGGTGLIGMWKAFAEIESLGWVAEGARPRMVCVQAEGCAPIVRAFRSGGDRAEPVAGAHTIADGLRVPAAIGDFLMLRILRQSGGTALSVSDDAMVDGMRRLGRCEGVSAAPEGGAALAALDQLVAAGQIAPNDLVVLFNTGGALKYLGSDAVKP
jgi:threonine synthase